ncbi:MobQ family relaxase [Acinetobacter towneri]|uniref:MobQ family relaxase n=1 Tax=Acinetobacter towneri TaxID=202956 RepID=UPI0029369AA0|nr:MobQ family relaxase [Acinetobacter towneri]MDV2485551.1 MobQ family relaxase [Acinetobacter towneri]
MAIYHFSVKTISRSDGRSAVAAAAYRSGEKLIDHRYGKEQDYTQKSGVEFTNIYAPENTNPELLDRNQLWNEVEKVERRKDALLAREFEIAFPQELTQSQRQAMLDDLCQDLVKRHGVVVDAAIHAPHTDGGSDDRNHHAHIMFTTRAIDAETGLFSSKKYRDFSRDNGTQTVCHWREHFAGLANRHLENAGHAARVDHRSYKEQGLELEATTHEGPEITQLRRKGIETEISLKNDGIRQRNLDRMQLPGLIKGLDQQIVATERLTQQLEQQQAELEQRKEAERLELEQQLEQLERDLARFYELQSAYSDITKTALDLHKRKEAEIEKIKKVRKKIKDFVAKCPPNNSIIREEETAYEQKKGYVPKYYITEALAAEKIRAITRTHEKELRATTRAVGFLKMVVQLKTLHRKLLDQNIELQIPRKKTIFGIDITGTPPSAETLDEDLKNLYFRPLGDDFEYAYRQATKTDAQKRREAQEQERCRQQDAQRRERERVAEKQAAAKEAEIDTAIETLKRDCGYGPDSDYNALHPQIPNISGLIVSELVKGRDVSGYVTQKIEMLEPELGKEYVKTYEDRVFGQIFELLNADRKLLKDDPKNLSKINGFYQKLQNHITEQAEIEQARLERDRVQSLEKKPTINAQKTKKLDNGRDNDHGLSM